MGKRIDQLQGLDDTPLDTPVDPRGTDWYRFLQDITELLEGGTVNWASETLEAIQLTVEQTKRVTEGQRRAVANIEAGAEQRRGRRRYEGFGNRRY